MTFPSGQANKHSARSRNSFKDFLCSCCHGRMGEKKNQGDGDGSFLLCVYQLSRISHFLKDIDGQLTARKKDSVSRFDWMLQFVILPGDDAICWYPLRLFFVVVASDPYWTALASSTNASISISSKKKFPANICAITFRLIRGDNETTFKCQTTKRAAISYVFDLILFDIYIQRRFDATISNHQTLNCFVVFCWFRRKFPFFLASENAARSNFCSAKCLEQKTLKSRLDYK